MEQATRMVRVELSSGAFDALSATHFVQRFAPHFHDTFAIGVVESGWAHLRTPRGDWNGGPGTILAFSPGEVHSAEPLTATGYTYRMVYPTAEFMHGLGLGAETALSSPVIHDPEITSAFRDAHAPIMAGRDSRRAELRLLDVVRSIVRRYAVDGPALIARESDVAIVRRARSVLHEHFAQRFTLAELAQVCGVSPYQLIRRFQRVMGVTPFAYLAQFRVNRAQAMLCSGTALSDVAYSCGFSDQSHLTRAFKQALGLPPGEYVRQVSAARP